MGDGFSILKPVFDNFLPWLALARTVWDTVSSPEFIVGFLWITSWLTALGAGLWQLDVVNKDWKAVVDRNVQDGRRIIAKGNLRTMSLLVLVVILNLLVGFNALFLIPNGYIDPGTGALINRTCLLLAAFSVSIIIFGKRYDRAQWEKNYHHE